MTKGCQYVVVAQGPLRVHSTSNTAFQNDGQTLPTSHPSEDRNGTGREVKGLAHTAALGDRDRRKAGHLVAWQPSSQHMSTSTPGLQSHRRHCPTTDTLQLRSGLHEPLTARQGLLPHWVKNLAGNAARLPWVTFFP